MGYFLKTLPQKLARPGVYSMQQGRGVVGGRGQDWGEVRTFQPVGDVGVLVFQSLLLRVA